MDIPGQFFLDILHVDFHGTFEKMMTMWCKEYKNEKNVINKFYLNPTKKRLLDELVIKVKYPNEIKRHQREIVENLGDLKGNEFKNVIFYLVPIFKLVLKENYFNHFAAYATSLRLMCQKQISKEDLSNAYILMDYFVKRFGQKNMYGLVNMDYKVHVHLHLALQVLYYGTLIYITCFIFEGKFLFMK
jgi:hypothetical protein